MSVRNGLVALLAEQPMHGYQLRQEFERRTGGTWPLNIGQVYTTVHRLVRDGLVEPVPQGGTGSTDDASEDDAPFERFRLTDAGRAAATSWWATPVERGAPARDELAIKLALAVTSPGVDVRGVIQRQRTETLRSLRDFTRLKVTPDHRRAALAGGGQAGDVGPVDTPVADARADLAWSLVLDSLIFGAEAEIRWLDHVEARLARASHEAATLGSAAVPAVPPTDAAPPGRLGVPGAASASGADR
ncbi:PadR family transcriptional regulator [Actinotalea sp. K2]|uniref:PadR family transcriptional regulator n=1 Tax=Actinotalea sp. K2 TaxID=2939438 RepID=UPI002016D5D3|nr:PadR family transcriptional regulator [Actinotalea sp. K2]MCL3861424.1 PadR family transcriptional regulator [Actinotalea sp. K2]